MRFLKMSLVLVAAALAITACASKSSSNDQSQSSAEATTAASSAATTTDNTTATTAPAGEAPAYPGATTQASGSNTSMGQSAAGTVMTTDDSFDKVYVWYQGKMPAGSERVHLTQPSPSALFVTYDASKNQDSVNIAVSQGKTIITIGHVVSVTK